MDRSRDALPISDERPTAILGFDETFLRPFARALIEAATTRAGYRMTILQEARVRALPGGRICDRPRQDAGRIDAQPFGNGVLISAGKGRRRRTLFQLPRTDSFLRAFAKMAYIADQALHDLLKDMDRVAKQRKLVANT